MENEQEDQFQEEVDELNKKYGINPEESDPDIPDEWEEEFRAILRKYGKDENQYI